MGHRRERGIDPSTAMEDPMFMPGSRGVRRTYQRATTYPKSLLDGVFLSDGSQGAVQLDSAGHTFIGFPKIAGFSVGVDLARAATVKPADREARRMPAACVLHRPGRTIHARGARPALFRCHNGPHVQHRGHAQGISDCAAGPLPRRSRRGQRERRGMPDESRADFWVFVDGQLKLKRMQIGPRDGVVQVDVELGPDDRFLTLVCTDSGPTRCCGFLIFGDPVLELVPVEEGRL